VSLAAALFSLLLESRMHHNWFHSTLARKWLMNATNQTAAYPNLKGLDDDEALRTILEGETEMIQ
jgi:hypothetical protein